MDESPLKSLGVLVGVVLVCSLLVSVAAVGLRPVQERHALLERFRNIASLTGRVPADGTLTDEELLVLVGELDARVVNLNTGAFEPDMPVDSVDARSAAVDPEKSVAIAPEQDLARLGRRAVHQVVYLLWDGPNLDRIILPINGQGMWSTLYGYLALESDLNTIAAVTFYEQAETAGLGDQIQRPEWQARWTGRRLADERGTVRFRIAPGRVDDSEPGAQYEVDGLTGATVTGRAVTQLVRFWFGESGYRPFLRKLSVSPPRPGVEN